MNGEGGEVYILRMGEPVKIIELAENLIILSGFRPNDEIEVVETGIRPGEKLFEELVISDEVAETSHPKILINRIARPQSDNLSTYLQYLKQAANYSDDEEVRRRLSELIPEARLYQTDDISYSNLVFSQSTSTRT
jgi:FlaA1/EpsC-like NDP-sugar epimerase